MYLNWVSLQRTGFLLLCRCRGVHCLRVKHQLIRFWDQDYQIISSVQHHRYLLVIHKHQYLIHMLVHSSFIKCNYILWWLLTYAKQIKTGIFLPSSLLEQTKYWHKCIDCNNARWSFGLRFGFFMVFFQAISGNVIDPTISSRKNKNFTKKERDITFWMVYYRKSGAIIKI